jgi:hypothetical protein
MSLQAILDRLLPFYWGKRLARAHTAHGRACGSHVGRWHGVLTDARRAGGAVVDASVSRDGGAPSAGHDDGDVVVADAGLAAELRGAGLKAVAALADGLGAGAGVAERGGDVGERVVGVGDKVYGWTWGLEVCGGYTGADGAELGC